MEIGKTQLMKAPVFIIACADHKKCSKKYGTKKGMLFSIQDASVAVQNMCLMAYGMGIGTCWIGNFDEKNLSTTFGLRSGLYPIAVLALGYPAYTPTPPKRNCVDEVCDFHTDSGISVYEVE